MPDTVSWPAVALALIAGLPGIIGACAALVAARRSGEAKAAVAEVKAVVNGHSELMQSKLDEALRTIGDLTGKPAKTSTEAPAGPLPRG